MSSKHLFLISRLALLLVLLSGGVIGACNDRDTELPRDAGTTQPDVGALSPRSDASESSTGEASVGSEAGGDAPYVDATADAADAKSKDADAASDAGAVDAKSDAPFEGGAYAATVLSDSPLVYYRFGEAMGTPGAVSSANSGSAFNASYVNFDGGAFGRPGLLAGDPNTSVSCSNASGNLISLPIDATTSALKFPGAFTIEAWVTNTSIATSTYTIVSTKGSNKDGYSFGVASAHLFLACHGQVNFGSTLTVPNDGTPHYVAVVFDGSKNATFHVDGQSVVINSPTPAAVTYASTTSLAICRFATITTQGFGWNGIVDEVALYPSALTSARIDAHRAAGGQ